jgi:serine/threonine protein kinase
MKGNVMHNSPSFSSPQPLSPGFLLRDRYRFQTLVERQDWPSGAFEASWIGYDSRQEKQVMICEVVIPDHLSLDKRSIMRTAASALGSLNPYPHIPSLLEAFSSQGRAFFVFERAEGETLLNRLQRLRRPMPESELVEFCLQMVDTLELLSQRMPPLVHGAIRPEHIYASENGSQYLLSHFSILVAGGTTSFFAGLDRASLSPYTAPEFAHGIVDMRSDLYSLLATAYHLATGNPPVASGGIIPHARQVNPALSPAFDTILTKGLHFTPQQRYQHVSQLRQDLLDLQLDNNMESARSYPDLTFAPTQPQKRFSSHLSSSLADANGPGSPILLPITPITPEEDEQSILPRPEDLPAMRQGNDQLVAATIFFTMFLGVTLATFFGQSPF